MIWLRRFSKRTLYVPYLQISSTYLCFLLDFGSNFLIVQYLQLRIWCVVYVCKKLPGPQVPAWSWSPRSWWVLMLVPAFGKLWGGCCGFMVMSIASSKIFQRFFLSWKEFGNHLVEWYCFLQPLLKLGRKLEDKLGAVNVETRSFALNLNTDDLHKNRELPGAFTCHLGVLDTTLPVKGTAHRRVRGTTMDEDATVNVFFDTQLTFLLLPTKKPAIHCKLLLSKKNKYILFPSPTQKSYSKVLWKLFVVPPVSTRARVSPSLGWERLCHPRAWWWIPTLWGSTQKSDRPTRNQSMAGGCWSGEGYHVFPDGY